MMRPPIIEIKLDKRAMDEANRVLRSIPGGLERVMPRAINRTIDSATADIKRRVAAKTGIKSSGVGKRLLKKKANRGNLTASLRATIRRVSLLDYKGTRPSKPGPPYPKKGVTFRSAKTGNRELIEHGFVAQMKSGHRGVYLRSRFTRRGFQTMQGGKKEAIVERRGPSIWAVAMSPEILQPVSETASKKMSKHINDQVGLELKRWRSR